jgi:PhoH-like ATPase
MRWLRGRDPVVWGIRPRNKEQQFAIDLLLDDSVRLVTLVGQAGTGKTLLALAAGLQKVA